jgi:hypothetical protein
MNIPIQQIRDIVDLIFSSTGYNIKNLNISFPHPLDIKIVRNADGDIVLSFTESLPKVSWKKYITLSAWIQGIALGKNGGTLKLKYLPDINFNYDDDSTKELFGQSFDTSDIEEDIYSEYDDEERQVLAKKCLHYASEWATIASQSGVQFSQCTEISKRQLKRDCKNFVMENIKSDPEIVAGSVILTFLLLYVVLPVVLKFILERLFKKLFS